MANCLICGKSLSHLEAKCFGGVDPRNIFPAKKRYQYHWCQRCGIFYGYAPGTGGGACLIGTSWKILKWHARITSNSFILYNYPYKRAEGIPITSELLNDMKKEPSLGRQFAQSGKRYVPCSNLSEGREVEGVYFPKIREFKPIKIVSPEEYRQIQPLASEQKGRLHRSVSHQEIEKSRKTCVEIDKIIFQRMLPEQKHRAAIKATPNWRLWKINQGHKNEAVCASKIKSADIVKDIRDLDPGKKVYLYTTLCHCERCEHAGKRYSICSVTGITATARGNTERINLSQCQSCGQLLMREADYRRYTDELGGLLFEYELQGMSSSSHKAGSSLPTLSNDSILSRCGYNVSQRSGMTEVERRNILSYIIDSRRATKAEVIRLLETFIAQHRSAHPAACSKWEGDLLFVNEYKLSEQKEVDLTK